MEHNIYLYSAVVGCSLVVIQVVLQIFGFIGDADLDSGHDGGIGDAGDSHDTHMDGDAGDGAEGHGNIFFGILSFKALCAFAGIFGLVGLMLMDTFEKPQGRVAIAFAAGVAGMFMVAWMMRSLSRLQATGSIQMRNAVGRSGSVYLKIPPNGSGSGKVTIEIQGRSQEFQAITEGPEISTGARVTVVSVEGDDTLKVVPL